MQEEIFGPVIPVLTYETPDEVIETVRAHDKPLALYIFSSGKANIEKLHSLLTFGSGCVKETLVHVISTAMPFGGVGESGMGQYHGKAGFDTFTHYTSIMDKTTHVYLDQRYQSYCKKNIFLARNLNFGASIYGKLKEELDLPFNVPRMPIRISLGKKK